jgi:tetratricopeptide (TPR) repeat protein
MNKRIKNINSKLTRNNFEDDLMTDRDDLALFDTIGEYMKGRFDLEDVKNDPALSETQVTVKEMISDYDKNILKNKENGTFIREVFNGERSDKELNNEIKFIKQEIYDNKLNDITAEWVREWHEKKQKVGVRDPKTEEIRDFITCSIDSSKSEPETMADEAGKNDSRRSFFVRYALLSAAALIGAFLLIRTLLPSSNPEKLFESYYKPFNAISPVTRSMNSNETDSYSSAIENYITGNYQRAATGFAGVVEKDPSAVSSQFYLGLSQLALKNYDQAINMFTRVANDSGEFGKEARWYLGLTYLKTANKQKAAECFEYLARSDGFYRERSEKILRRLK